MKEWKIEVTKLTDISLLHKCASFTSGKDCTMSLHKAYANKHSIVRSQIFVVEMTDIPLFCASQFVRSTQGVNWYQRTKRTDRGGADFRKVCKKMSDNAMTAYNAILQGDKETAQHETLCLSDDLDDLPDKFDRYAPTSLLGIMNAEAIMNMSAKRLCHCASAETREIWELVLYEVLKCDPDLIKFCVKPCVAHGVCRETKSCGFVKSDLYRELRDVYKLNFTTNK